MVIIKSTSSWYTSIVRNVLNHLSVFSLRHLDSLLAYTATQVQNGRGSEEQEEGMEPKEKSQRESYCLGIEGIRKQTFSV